MFLLFPILTICPAHGFSFAHSQNQNPGIPYVYLFVNKVYPLLKENLMLFMESFESFTKLNLKYEFTATLSN